MSASTSASTERRFGEPLLLWAQTQRPQSLRPRCCLPCKGGPAPCPAILPLRAEAVAQTPRGLLRAFLDPRYQLRRGQLWRAGVRLAIQLATSRNRRLDRRSGPSRRDPYATASVRRSSAPADTSDARRSSPPEQVSSRGTPYRTRATPGSRSECAHTIKTMRINDGCRSGSRGRALELLVQGVQEATHTLGAPARGLVAVEERTLLGEDQAGAIIAHGCELHRGQRD
jgi:hypothetical protein